MSWMEYLNAFRAGGAICAVCQVLIDRTKLTPARLLVALVVTGVVFQAPCRSQPLLHHAGAGPTLPLLRFGASLRT